MNWQQSLTQQAHTSTQALPPLVVCPLTSWSAISMVGDDKKSYLQGQITCDVVSLEANQSTLGAHCDAKGKMWSIFRLFHHLDGYALITRASAFETALNEIKKYAVFSKVEIKKSDDILLGVMGDDAKHWLSSFVNTEESVTAFEGGTAVKLDDKRWLLSIQPDHADAVIANSPVELTNDSIWDWAEVESGLPSISASQQNQHIPQALNLQALGGISFTKGCYTGQETVARAKYRGMNKRALFKVTGELSAELPADATLERAVGENWRNAGSLIVQYQFDDNKACGLIVLPKDIEFDTALRLTDQPETRWQIEALPYSLEEDE
ncbi:tRNA-modifying protein YgfZ [Vibrio tapetis]|uniref:tRNA-modifying protein YgfZ n=1 Tax=Vibrio tapetis subsp. tapetis TaxID=1671868 RepID=A0A2N8Z808_9VIBR|nr:tRNA-modifying protein YgfZ [Vibrio tapetis]SON48044.1 enzyme component involved in 2-methylthio-6-iodeadenosine formation [Vibrio tapetis subsp. tapetis]